MKIMVTGGLGFVGLHLVKCFAEKGADVVAADVSSLGAAGLKFSPDVCRRVELRTLDVRSRADYQSLADETGVDAIVHAAALTPDAAAERANTAEIIDVNLNGAINAVLAAAGSAQVKNLVMVSSSGVYGTPKGNLGVLQTETDALELDGLYALTKYCAELMMQRCAYLSEKRMAAVRLTAIYGEMERPTGSRTQMSHIKRLSDALLAGRSVKVAGRSVRRDWMYGGDAAEAVWALLNVPRWSYPVYNLGAQETLAFEQVIDVYSRAGLNAAWVEDPREADIAMRPDQERAPMDTSRLKEDTGFILMESAEKRLDRYVRNLRSS